MDMMSEDPDPNERKHTPTPDGDDREAPDVDGGDTLDGGVEIDPDVDADPPRTSMCIPALITT